MTTYDTRRTAREAMAAWDYWCAVDRRERAYVRVVTG